MKHLCGLLLLLLVFANPASGQENFPTFFDSSIWSPDGNRIAFVSNLSGNNDIWIINVDGTNLTNLTVDNLGIDFDPQWSPGGNFIAYTSAPVRDYTNYDLMIADIQTGNRVNLTQDKSGYNGSHTWSPDGNWIAFESYQDEIMSRDIWITSPDGLNQRNLTGNSVGSYNSPQWVDANRILLRRAITEYDGLWTITIDNEVFEQILSAEEDSSLILKLKGNHLIASDTYKIWLIEWNALTVIDIPIFMDESQRIANLIWSPVDFVFGLVILDESRVSLDIWIHDMENQTTSKLTEGGYNADFSWSPDGNSMLVSSDRGGEVDIWQVDLSTNEWVNLTSDLR